MGTLAALCLLLQDRPLQLSEDVELRARIRAWHPWINGGAKGHEDNPVLAFDDDLDVDSPGLVPAIEIGLWAPERKDPSGRGIWLSATCFSTSGDRRLEDGEQFEGSVFPAGTELRGRLRFLTFGVDAMAVGRNVAAEDLAWGFSVGLHYLEAEVHVSGGGASESEEYGDGNLKLGFWGEWRPLPRTFLSGRLAAYTDVFTLFLGVDSGHFAFDGEVAAGLDVAPVRLELGARVFAWSLTWTESEVDVVAYGPFAALTLRF